MRWIDMTPTDLERAVSEDRLCIVPMGSLERHGEHLPFGCDCVIAETGCLRAAEETGDIVFPAWYMGQVHEAACFSGTVNYPPEMLIAMLRQTFSEIARNGFKKIVVVSGHGGNNDMLRFFDMSTMNEGRTYSLYSIGPGNDFYTEEEEREAEALMETDIMGHADEQETSLYMGCREGLVRQEYSRYAEPIPALNRTKHLKGVYTSFFWYADYPENVGGTPSKASAEKGKRLMEIRVKALVRTLETIRADGTVPALQEEFLKKCGKR